MQRVSAWFATLSARGQMLWGCLGVIILTSCLLYSLGAVSFFIRPYLIPTPVAFNTVIPPTPTPFATQTQQPASTLQLPGSTLVATPTQAPLPTNAPTDTPTPTESATGNPDESPPGGLFVIPTSTLIPEVTTPPPTRTRLRPTATYTPGPTRTKKPTKTPKKDRVPSAVPSQPAAQ
jgi:hypothetical protein